jgi:spore germination protein GerM
MLRYKPPNPKCFFLKTFSVLLVGCAVFSFSEDARTEAVKPSRGNSQFQTGRPAPLKKTPVHLYFIGRSNYFLMSEQRTVIHPDDTAGFARAIVEALISGPQEGLQRAIPPGTKLRAVYTTPDGICYVDLSGEIRDNHPGGSNTELLTTYSIVNSLILNSPEIERVKILIDGNEALTLAGHINLQLPAKANMLLIR